MNTALLVGIVVLVPTSLMFSGFAGHVVQTKNSVVFPTGSRCRMSDGCRTLSCL
jgi:hypothetical protein